METQFIHNTRDYYKQENIKEKYQIWIKRHINTLNLVKNVDYSMVTFNITIESRGIHQRIDCLFTDRAFGLLKSSRSKDEQADTVDRLIMAVDKLETAPAVAGKVIEDMTFEELMPLFMKKVREADKLKIKQQEERLAIAEPKAEKYTAWLDKEGLASVLEISKAICFIRPTDKKIIGDKTLFTELKKLKIINKDCSLTSESVNKGYGKSVFNGHYTDGLGNPIATTRTRFTPKGIDAIVDKLKGIGYKISIIS